MATSTEKHKRYPAYKHTDVEWLGDIPAHWETSTVKHQYTIQLGKMLQNGPSNQDDVEVPYLRAVHVQWFDVQTSDPPTMWASQKENELFGIEKGDLLVCEGGEGGRCGIVNSNVDGYIIQNALHRVRSRENSRNDYLQYTLSTTSAMGWFEAINERATIAHFTGEKFGALKIPLPPLTEQNSIAVFLDRETARIDALVAKKERLVELLQEKRTALITRAVTKGLDPNASMKDSGVEWLGEIPAHWDVKRLKVIADIRYGLGQPPKEIPDGLPLIRATNVYRGHITDSDMLNVDPEDVPLGRRAFLSAREIVVVRSGAYTADSAIIPKKYAGAIAGYDMVVTVKDAEPEFIAIALLCPYVRDAQLVVASTRSAQPHLNAEELGDALILLPTLPEQQAIASFVDQETAKLDSLITKIQEAIERLKELRTALISAAVTGRIDVREEAGCK
ncbi:MAG: hypothetical protein F4X65_15780 [Chloroflexi bacterium]|nr:hypothetical protein [Chloroflexota bacterium]